MQKSKGEGSRGGKIVGHYKSGRAKYDHSGRVKPTAKPKAVPKQKPKDEIKAPKVEDKPKGPTINHEDRWDNIDPDAAQDMAKLQYEVDEGPAGDIPREDRKEVRRNLRIQALNMHREHFSGLSPEDHFKEAAAYRHRAANTVHDDVDDDDEGQDYDSEYGYPIFTGGGIASADDHNPFSQSEDDNRADVHRMMGDALSRRLDRIREKRLLAAQAEKKELGKVKKSAAGGEGSRGGHVLGHTKSGKPIYQAGRSATNRLSPKGIRGFTAQDHADAAAAHTALAGTKDLPAEHMTDAHKMAAFHTKAASKPAPSPPSAGPPIQAPVAHTHAEAAPVAPAAKAPRAQSAAGKANRAMASLDSRMSKFNEDFDGATASGDWKKQRAAIESHAARVHDEHFGHMSAADHFAAAQAAPTHAGTQAGRQQASVARAAHAAMATAMLKRQRTAAAAAPVAKSGYRPEASQSVAQTFSPVGPDGYELDDTGILAALLAALAEAGVPLDALHSGDLIEVGRPEHRDGPYQRPTLIRASTALAQPELLVKYAMGDDSGLQPLGKGLFGLGPKLPKMTGVPPKPTLAKPPAAQASAPAAAPPPAAPAPPPAPAVAKPAAATPSPPPKPAAPPAASAPKPPGNATLGRTTQGHTVWAGANADSVLYRAFTPRDHAQAASLHAIAGNHQAAADHRAMHAKLVSPSAGRPSAATLAARPQMGGGRVYRSVDHAVNVPNSNKLGYFSQTAKGATELTMNSDTLRKNADNALGRLRKMASEPISKGLFGMFGAKAPATIPAPPPVAVAAPGAAGAKGEGSRGGKIVGHTRSGKPIYGNQHANNYKQFSTADHGDAAQAHEKAAYVASKAGDLAAAKEHGALRYQHVQALQRATGAPTIVTGHGDAGLPVRQRAARVRARKPKKAPADVMGAAATQADA